MGRRLRVVVADDQARARQGMKALLATWPEVDECREAANGKQAIALIEESLPDVVLIDARMPEMDGLEATRLIKASWPQVKVIVLSMYSDCSADALAAGADAFVSKGDLPEKLLAMLAAVVDSGAGGESG
jgi:DNA-binding NarL/FixJ family response regulator